MKYAILFFPNAIKLSGLLLLSLVIFSSCQKVIQLDLNNAAKKYVIEAIVTDQPGTTQVEITQTKNFDENNDFPGISGAVVSISENGGSPVSLNETTAGKYEAPSFYGTSGYTYSLTVKIGGQTFTAQSTMPQRVNLDTIFITDELLFTTTQKIVNTVYQDPPGRGNNYRFIQYINGKKGNQIIVNNDDYTDGRTVTNKLFYFPDDDDDSAKIKSGDRVDIDMLCIDANVYKYWFSLDRSATGGSGQATPSNPVTNLQGGALGYFSAHTLQTKTMIVP